MNEESQVKMRERVIVMTGRQKTRRNGEREREGTVSRGKTTVYDNTNERTVGEGGGVTVGEDNGKHVTDSMPRLTFFFWLPFLLVPFTL